MYSMHEYLNYNKYIEQIEEYIKLPTYYVVCSQLYSTDKFCIYIRAQLDYKITNIYIDNNTQISLYHRIELVYRMISV